MSTALDHLRQQAEEKMRHANYIKSLPSDKTITHYLYKVLTLVEAEVALDAYHAEIDREVTETC